MYAVGDFNDYSYESEKKKSRKKKLIIIGVSLLAITLIVTAGVVGALFYTNHESKKDNNRNLHSVSKSVKMMCSATDYSSVCESSLSKAVNSSSPAPEDLVKAAIAVIADEAKKAFSHSKLFKSKDPMIRGAIEDCKQLYLDSKDELETALKHIAADGLENLPKRSHDIRIWLSAVMSYQQTCIDGFPDGELKTKMNQAMDKARQLTSNALAIVKEATNFFSTLKLSNFNRRRLLEEEEEEEEEEVVVDDDGYPSWVAEGDRRMLKGYSWKKATPNVTVAKDGSGDFLNITDALNAMPKKYEGRYVIYVKEGVYEETVNVTKKMVNVTMYGDGGKKTIITGSKNFVDGTRTFKTATFVASGAGFMAMGLCFRNTAGAAKHQAVALRVQSDQSIFLFCRMEGYQDTLYAQTHRQFYRGCVISGTIDFIFGDAAAVIQNSVLVVRRPLSNQQNIVTANGRVDPHETTGFVLHNCRIIPDHTLTSSNISINSYLGRPWKQYSKTIIMESRIGSFIHPDGYTPWTGDFALKTLYYAEYNNSGEGSDVTRRVPWPGFKVISRSAAMRFTVANFLQGRDWIKRSDVPVRFGLYH